MTSPDTTAQRPRAVVFGVLPGGAHEGERLGELKDLLASAEIDCVGEIVQHRERPFPHSYLGPGKLRELAAAVKESAATCAVCEDDMTPGQVAAVLDALDVDVLDRTELILSVFARHAHTLEGTLQVDLAQLQYELTRVRGQGQVMSRLGAGTDMRGPGEQKLEVDRRVIRQRILQLKKRIDKLARTRRTQRARRVRASVPLITLAGYTNAGKSTLLNALTDAGVSVRDRLFETLDPTTRTFRHRDRDYVVTDTVGFIRKLPHLLVDAFASTLEETRVADLLLIVVDASLDPDEIDERQTTVAEVLAEIGSDEVPRLVVFNKTDRLDDDARERLVAMNPDAAFIAARTGVGLSDLRQRIAAFFDHQLRPVSLLVPYTDGAVLNRLRGIAADIREENTPDGVIVEARVPEDEYQRCRQYVVPRRAERMTREGEGDGRDVGHDGGSGNSDPAGGEEAAP
jgi:GTPase